MKTMVRSKFTIDDMGEYEGYHDPSTYWNGWACPAFDRETATKLLTDMQKEGMAWMYDAANDTFRVATNGDLNSMDTEYCDGFRAMVDGEEKVVYGIGAYSWCWNVVDSEIPAPPPVPRVNSLVKYISPPGYEDYCPFDRSKHLLFLGEIVNMPGHCIIVDGKGKIHWGWHTDNFVELTDEEV